MSFPFFEVCGENQIDEKRAKVFLCAVLCRTGSHCCFISHLKILSDTATAKIKRDVILIIRN